MREGVREGGREGREEKEREGESVCENSLGFFQKTLKKQ